MKEKEKEVIHGRTNITSPDRMFRSKRAVLGKISVIKKECPYCHHHKAFVNYAEESSNYGQIKCSRCKRVIT